jgi:hypothetical protein
MVTFWPTSTSDSSLDLMLDGNKGHNNSNHKTLKGKAINQEAWELRASTWHYDVYEQSFSLTFFDFH